MIELDRDIFLEEAWVRFYGVRLRTRMTVVRLSGDRLFVHSPTRLDDDVRSRLDGLGRVAFVVAPNKLHNLALGEYLEAFPDAAFYAAPGLPERRPGLAFSGVLGDEPEPGWADEIDQALTRGNVFFSEALFLHRASESLIVTDLVENVDEHTASRVGRALAASFGVPERPIAAPEHRLYTTDAEAAERAFERVAGWAFRRIVLAHGALIEENAPEVLRCVCDELVDGARRRRPVVKRFFEIVSRLQ